MGKYSSDSENEKRSSKSSKNRGRHRSSSTDSTDSKSRSKRVKKSHRRSRSRDRYSKSRRSRSSSYSSKSKTRRSNSRERSRYRRSASREKYRRSKSRDRYRSRRSRSKSYIREYSSKPKRRTSSSSSGSSNGRDRTKTYAKNKSDNGQDDEGQPCGVHYYVKLFVGENETDRTHKRSTVSMAIRKVQYSPSKQGRQPCTVVRKDFMMSPGELELEVTLDKQLYHHGEKIAVNICIRNNSNKVVKKIKAMIQQGVDVALFQNGQYRTTIASIETQEGCPINPGSSLQKVVYLLPLLSSNKDRRGIALDGQLKKQDTNLASTTLLASPDQRDAFGIIVSYAVKIKLYLGALGGELAAELPFVLMHPKPGGKGHLVQADSQADVEMFRQDTIDPEIDGVKCE